MLQELIEFCGESTDSLWMSRREEVTSQTIIRRKSEGRAFMLRIGVIMKNRAIVRLNVVNSTDVGHDVCHACFCCK